MNKAALKRASIQSEIIKEEEELAEKEKQGDIEAANEEGGDMQLDDKSVAMSSRSAVKSKRSNRAGEASTLTATSLLPDRNNVEDEFKGILLKLWKQISGNFNSQMKLVLGKQKCQRENIQQYLYNVQVQFLVFLKRRDNK